MSSIRFPIYLDNHATTRVDPRVVNAMLPYFTEHYGNPSSRDHRYGWHAKEAVELARRRIAEAVHAQTAEILFTSGATESNNLALKGVAEAYRDAGNRIVTCATEHSSVLDVCRTLELSGFIVTVIPVDEAGRIDLEALESALIPGTIMVSVMIANNEIGTLAPIRAIGSMCRARNILFHTDAVQAFTRIPIDVRADGIDLMSLSAHKIYGPKGVGALYVRRGSRGVRLMPQMDGGGQESGMRPGTMNVPSIVGFGEATAIAMASRGEETRRITALRDALETGLVSAGGVTVNGDRTHRLPNNLNVTFDGVKASDLMSEAREIALSTGSACTAEDIGREEYSHVLRAIGLDKNRASSTLRIGVGRFTTEEEISYTIRRITEFLHHRRASARPSSRIYS
ncbi:MAG: cysteine desulfurase family protein [Acidobacteriota bacterium]